jgi:photosystem II stability/assembly factor-like uncharacterized protein
MNQTTQQVAVTAPALANVPSANAANQIRGAAAPAAPESLPISGRDVTELQPLQSQGLEQQTHGGSGESKVEKIKPLEGIVVTSATKVIKSAPRATTASALTASATPNWTISSTGSLQRSFDQGRTWQDVHVNGNPSMDAEAAQMNYSMNLKKQGAAADQNEKNDSDDEKKAAAPIAFRAVAANGADVWAGGSGGLLYHSIDSGAHWIRVVPSAREAFLTGDIISVVFTDVQHGRVMTSAKETWITDNAGKTWQKQ